MQGVYKARLEPNWFSDNTRFWYRNDLARSAKEFVTVDAASGDAEPAFDHEKLAASLSKAAETTYEAKRLPFNRIEFTDGDKAVRFVAGESQWECNLESYECTKVGPAPEDNDNNDDEQGDGRGNRRGRRFGRGGDRRGAGGGPSPDGKWNAFVRNNNIYLAPSRQ